MSEPEELLPRALLQKGSLAGREWAWRPIEIPEVIEAARNAGLVSLGGQLQFRLPNGTCECYWVDVSTDLTSDLQWLEKVENSAKASLADFHTVNSRYDFIAEGRKAFSEHFDKFERDGGDPSEAMWFAWYVETQDSLAALDRQLHSS